MRSTVEERREAIETRHPIWQETTLCAYFERAVDAFGERDLVVTDDETLNYKDVLDLSCRIAAGLEKKGLRPGDRVGIIMANYPIIVPLLFAIWQQGLVAVPINILYRTEELSHVVRQSRCQFLITMAEFRGQDFLSHLDRMEPQWRAGIYEKSPYLKGIAVYGSAGGSLTRFEELTQQGFIAAGQSERRISANDAAIIMYTSGTTGYPKGVILTHDNLLRSAYAVAYHHAFEDGRRAIFSLPMYHAYGVIQGLLAGLIVGGAMIPQLKFEPAAMLSGIGTHRASYLMAVPTMTLALLEEAKRRRYDFSSLRAIHNAAAPTPLWVWEEIQRTFGCNEVFTSYGQTETTAMITGTLPGDPIQIISETQGLPALGGVAGLPGPGNPIAEFKIVDPDTGGERLPGQIGEICTRGPLNTQGYFEQPDETAKLFLQEGWLRTGDLGAFRSDGYLAVTGRVKELYKSGGELVSPKEVEDLLTKHPDISQAYVVGVPDEHWGESGCAWIIPSPGTDPSLSEIASYLYQNLAKFKVPSRLYFIASDDLPKTGTGKVQKSVLRERAILRANSSAII
jgi:fatty-acyl-CoA synthase